MLFCTLAAIGADFCYMKMTSDKKHYQLLVNLKLKSIITIPEYDQEDFKNIVFHVKYPRNIPNMMLNHNLEHSLIQNVVLEFAHDLFGAVGSTRVNEKSCTTALDISIPSNCMGIQHWLRIFEDENYFKYFI